MTMASTSGRYVYHTGRARIARRAGATSLGRCETRAGARQDAERAVGANAGATWSRCAAAVSHPGLRGRTGSILHADPSPRERESVGSMGRILGYDTVGDVMTTAPLVTCNESMSIDAALELVVNCRVTGLPVVDEENLVVGVVSDYDLLALEDICGVNEKDLDMQGELFPRPGATWKAFNAVQNMLAKSGGKTVGDVMTRSPTVVRPNTNIEDAARILLSGRFRRLPVVDEDNKLIGILTRGNIVSAALMMKRMQDAVKNGEKVGRDVEKV